MFYPTKTLGSRTTCTWCGKSFRMQRIGHRFCSPRCRKTVNRAETVTGAFRSVASAPHSAVGRFSPKNKSKINTVQGGKARSNPLNLVGGHRAPNAAPLDPVLRRAIIEVEVFGGREWRQTISADGVVSFQTTLQPRALIERGTPIAANSQRAIADVMS